MLADAVKGRRMAARYALLLKFGVGTSSAALDPRVLAGRAAVSGQSSDRIVRPSRSKSASPSNIAATNGSTKNFSCLNP